MVSKISKKGLEYLKKNQLKEGKEGWVLFDDFREYLMTEFEVKDTEADAFLQEMDKMEWVVHHTEATPRRIYISEKGEELLDKLSLWGWFRRNATAISSLAAIIGLIITLMIIRT